LVRAVEVSYQALTVFYKCSCMQDEGSFQMKARGEHEPIGDFMERLGAALGRDHIARNPLCRETKVEYVRMLLPKRPDGELTPVGST
jgi:hypothetical protein